MRFLIALCLIPVLQISPFACHHTVVSPPFPPSHEQHRRHQRSPPYVVLLSDMAYAQPQALSSAASLGDSEEPNLTGSDEGSEVETLGAFSLASKPLFNLTPLLAGQGAFYRKRSTVSGQQASGSGGSSSLHDLSIVAPLNVLRKSKIATENMRNLIRQQNQIRENERILSDKGKRASYANYLD